MTDEPIDSISSNDIERFSLMWETREEILLQDWASDCLIRSTKHEKASKKNKILYGCFALPSILIPLTIGGLPTMILPTSTISSILMMLSGVFIGITTFFNFGKKTQAHAEYSNKYQELVNELTSELAKPKKNRMAADVYIERIKQTYNKLVEISPTL